ncbi:alanine--tRNA ligase [Candidatus Gracilibacteria bacterium]|nr:alanine--tRNA ligase [Candidatus Gracilibacteria bacterium]
MSLATEIRTKYLEYYRKQNHAIVPSSPLLPENDPTTLFTGSGMQPMLAYLLGEPHPLGTRIADSQKCFRAVDIDEVGDNRHTTFFEMLGNWSLGDYFKKEQIPWMWDFLINELGLNPQNLYITCHIGSKDAGIARDDEAANLWKELFQGVGIDARMSEDAATKGMMPGERIFFYEDKKNWWSRAGVPAKMPVGEPGGPDSEMFWDFDPTVEKRIHERSIWKDLPCHVNCDCGRFLEIGNNVFMAYKKESDGFHELAGKNIDFGGGLERIAMAMHNTPDIFMTGVFDSLRKSLEGLTGKTYGGEYSTTNAFRIIMDHLRAATFLIGDGAFPSNVDAGYFVRRLIRRAIRAGRRIGLTENFTHVLAESVIADYSDAYPNLLTGKDAILRSLSEEEDKFRRTLERGEREIEKLLSGSEKIDGKKAFWIFETFGFPREMTEEIILEHIALGHGGLEDIANVEILREKLYEANPALKGEMEVFARDFAESAKAHADLSRTAAAGKFAGGLADHSDETTALHSTCHLMLAGLRKVLGAHVHQAGSNITAERLRFDFSHPEKMTPEQITAVEAYVNTAITSGITVTVSNMDKNEAKESGVEGSFWEKYPDIVKVYSMVGADGVAYSRELCGGPHVENSKDMGTFKIIKEESSSAGVRRIKAVLEK